MMRSFETLMHISRLSTIQINQADAVRGNSRPETTAVLKKNATNGVRETRLFLIPFLSHHLYADRILSPFHTPTYYLIRRNVITNPHNAVRQISSWITLNCATELFHDLLLRCYLYHCQSVWSVTTAHNLAP